MDVRNKELLITILFFILPNSSFADHSNQTPCGGPTDLLSFVNRPTVGDSACVAPEKTFILETGYQYQQLSGGGTLQNFPAAELRLGLANRYEINIYLPNYVVQTEPSAAGFTPVALGLKHEVVANEKWVFALEGFAILPSGTATYGSRRLGEAFYGVFSYNLSSTINVSGMLGGSSQSESIVNGGQRYFSVNPDLVLAWSKEKISLYGEVYGQSKTGPQEGSGFNMDAGVLYLIRKNIVIDLEIGHKISGNLGGFNQYIGSGISIQFS